ncbi:hypothetical protein TRIUR3_11359 [Triticum urartu]|uniref:Replication factor-A protein 1 N-terminal domain-containing protein n=1 Tax=Triticum urartu TaxID=4572 RepID=M7YDX8_TRIUA|nr:hypothetical protein TRIUR3_11359 [Triticum urartu]
MEAPAAAAQHSERFRMLLSDGVHSQQSMLGTGLNDLIKDGTLRVGSIVHLTDMTCNTIQKRRCQASGYAELSVVGGDGDA